MAADVPISQVDRPQVIELITAGRSGNLGIAPAEAAAVEV
jgi:D-xylose transport system ATP-binding protein